jgi:PilZ domain
VAVRIDRVEREFILSTAAEAKIAARLRAEGRSLRCRVVDFDAGSLGFAIDGEGPSFSPREQVSVSFDFRGQAVAFDAPVISSASGHVELEMPQSMYRSLSRRWARVMKPKNLSVDFILPDAELSLECPISDEWVDVELPELRAGLDSSNLASLVDSFKAKASAMASEGRVVMYKDRGPADYAEEMATKMGRILYVPSAVGALPHADPYPAGRIITQAMAADFEGLDAFAEGSKLSAYLGERAAGGFHSGIWCPILYYRYAVGIVQIANERDRPQALDFGAVDLAWEFSRVLAWFLKRHGYFVETAGSAAAAKRGSIVDASPAGLLVVLPSGGPKIEQGSVIRLRLGLKDRGVVCSGKVARRYDEGEEKYCGIAFMDLTAQDKAMLSLDLYGEEEGIAVGAGAGA